MQKSQKKMYILTMFRVLPLFCILAVPLALLACSGEPAPQNSDSQGTTSSNSNGEGGNTIGAYLALPGNADKSAIRAKYETYMEIHYVTYEEDLENGVFNPSLAQAGMEGSARIKWISGNPPTPNETVSEGIGYGMLLAALNEDFERFDKLWHYHKAYRQPETELMIWRITSFRPPTRSGIATDADIDVCAALFIAYKKTGNTDYLNDAIAIGRSLFDKTLSDDLLLLPAIKGNGLGDGTKLNISYMSLAAIKLLAIHDSERNYNAMLEANLAYIERVSQAGDGLWPDWSNPAGEPINPQNNSCDNLSASEGPVASSCLVYNKEGPRIPWRIAWYYHWFGDNRAKAILDRAFSFVFEKTEGNSQNIKLWYGYDDGRFSGTTGSVMSWTSLCATGLGSAQNSDWNTACNQRLISRQVTENNYYANSLALIYTMLFNGNFDL